MSLLDTASLIVTPNGYKEGKLYSVIPSDGSGDMSVTRATTATRVNSAGLVELVPYNLLTYSQDFSNAAWLKGSVSITSNTTTAPNGTTTADTVTDTAITGYLFQDISVSGAGQIVTISVYAKKTNTNWLNFSVPRSGATTSGEFRVWFNISNGTVGTTQNVGAGVVLDTNIESVGNGWFRCSLTGYVADALAYTLYLINTNADNSFSSTVGNSRFQWGAQAVEGSVAKDYQKTETRLNIPRLDYSNGTCPSLLVEPQRTNLALYSSSFDNAAWGKDISVTITANYSASPSGVQDADRFQKNATSGLEGITQNQFGLASGAKAFSVYLKSNTGSNQNAFLLYANLQTQAITITSEWQRFDVVFNAITTVDYLGIVATSALDVSIWGAQLEAGSYATSYIPTTSASVTRNADVISKTGISSLIGQTEGTLFLDFYYDGSTNNHMIIRDSGYATYIYFNSQNANELWGQIQTAGIQFSMSATAGRYKMALAYKSGSSALYINGTQIGTSATTFSVAGTISEVDYSLTTPNNKINASALWKTRLTNTQLAQLTTI